MNNKKFIFTMTPGRTGTIFLTHLLKANITDSEVHHEILGYNEFGINTPDMSHFTLFNSQGNVDKVRDFWHQKLTRIGTTPSLFYAETSHLLLKAGLAENIDLLMDYGEVHFIYLKRDMLKTVVSYVNHHSFVNLASIWLWHLDPRYPKNIYNPGPLLNLEIIGEPIWYFIEMRARAEYYKLILDKKIHIHEVDLESITSNTGACSLFNDLGVNIDSQKITIPPPLHIGPKNLDEESVKRIKEIIDIISFDPKVLAKEYIKAGRSFEKKT